MFLLIGTNAATGRAVGFIILGKRQGSGFIEAFLPPAAPSPPNDAEEGQKTQHGYDGSQIVLIHDGLPRILQRGSENLQVLDQRLKFGLVADGNLSCLDLVGSVGNPHLGQGGHLRLDVGTNRILGLLG